MTTFIYSCVRDGIAEVRHARTTDRTRQPCPSCGGPVEPRWGAAPAAYRSAG